MPLVLRNVKNAELSWPEVDGNFLYLENKIDDLVQMVSGDEIVKVTPQGFLPGQEDQARANISAASLQQVADLEVRVDDLESFEYVSYSAQAMLPAQQQTARDNIDSVGNPEMQATAVPDWSTQIQSLINF